MRDYRMSPTPRSHHHLDGSTTKACIAIVGISLVEIVALLTGHNGTMLRVSIAALAALGGFTIGRLIRKE
jgi:hypothetical protein